jgi:hypothetical protein
MLLRLDVVTPERLTLWLKIWLGVLLSLAILAVVGIALSWSTSASRVFIALAVFAIVVNTILLGIRAIVVHRDSSAAGSQSEAVRH